MPRAPKICSEPTCFALVYDGRRCEEHRPAKQWANKGWDSRRNDTEQHRMLKSRVLGGAGYRCQLRYEDICTGLATQVDRIDNEGDYTDHNCQAVCVPCHRHKTSVEGHRAQGHNVSERHRRENG